MPILSMLVPSIILVVALVTDIRERKIYNKWVLVAMFLAVANSYYFFGFDGLSQGALAAGTALIMTLPLVLIGALGAGDMKLMFAFGLTATYQSVFSILILSLFWGALIGIGMAFYRGRGLELLKNTVRIIASQPHNKNDYQRIPFTVAIVCAWITFILIGMRQGAFS